MSALSIDQSIEQLCINTIRTLSMDAVQAAKSGHPGTPMALAPVGYVLWNDWLKYDPQSPLWPVRDRFVLSCGHASMLLYALIHLAGVEQVDSEGVAVGRKAITLDQIRQFRQWGSPCAGHPEYRHASGIETTTGPLGQGIGTSVGMAIAAKWCEAHFNKPGFELFGNDTYALCSDGDLMEGVSQEAASLAGHLKLSNLCWIYDDNHITIEGNTSLAFNEDVAARFESLGWQVRHVDDANDLEALNSALQFFKENDQGPTLIVVRSVIGYGSPNKANDHSAHGAPLGEEEVRLTKEAYGWPADAQFLVPEEVLEHFAQGIRSRGESEHKVWLEKLDAYAAEYPELFVQWKAMQAGALPDGWDAEIPQFEADEKGLATRVSSGKVLNGMAKKIPWFLGGSADLAPSTMTHLAEDGDFEPGSYGNRNFHFGIREHGMAAACNGMALSGLLPYGGTFFVFSDYMRPSVRLSALMKLPVIYVLTHDSIGLGEDGPTHQPVEHLSALRAMPGLRVFRPGDANEVAEAYRAVLSDATMPTAMVLTRQALPTLDRTAHGSATETRRGGYVLADCDGTPEIILLGTGSELAIALEAWQQLVADGVAARLVSLPCWELFDAQDEDYRDKVLPPQVVSRVAVEAAVSQGWEKYLGATGRFVGMTDYGASAPYQRLYEEFGITVDCVVAEAKDLLAEKP
ncbi:MAG: transketolase [Planctomycetota bacterium]|nr:transketolase [Planctomycetota bacterium]